MLRFHVLANSDSEADQELKLDVRDAVGVYICDPNLVVASRKDLKGYTFYLSPSTT